MRAGRRFGSRYRSLFALTGAVLCSGCATGQFKGVQPIYDANGAVQVAPQDRGSAAAVDSDTLDLKKGFQAAAADAARSRDDTDLTALMVNNGTLLASANCSDFFRGAAQLQQRANFARSAVAPVLSVLTSIVAFSANAGDENWIRGLAIGSSAVLAGISLVDQNFLFGAENIIEVEELTKRALAAHRDGIRSLGPLTFVDGVQQLIDHQVICTPASILKLTKQSIAAGDVAAVATGVANADQQALEGLAASLGLIGSANSQQAAALWRLYQSGVPADNIPTDFADSLTALGLGKLIDPPVPAIVAADGSVSTPAQPAKLGATGQAVKGQVIAALKSFSPATQNELAQAASDGRSDVALSGASSGSQKIRLTVH